MLCKQYNGGVGVVDISLGALHLIGIRHGRRYAIEMSICMLNLRKWRAAKRPLLKPEHAAKRLAWALEYRNFTLDDWEHVKDPRTIWLEYNDSVDSQIS